MKRIILFFAASFLIISSFAQTNIPQLVSFSAVVRDANNQPLANTPITIRLTFKQGGQNGTLVYCAIHQNTTNQNGFMSLQLNREVLGTGCNGAPSNAFQNIPWENGGFWMEVEYQTVPGSPFVNLGQLELASSFYAFAAGTAEKLTSITTSGAQNGDVLVYNSTSGKFEPGQSGIVSLEWSNIQNKPNFATVATSGDYNDLTNTPNVPTIPTNVSAFNNDAEYLTVENQQLSVSATGDTLKLQNGGFVIIQGISAANAPAQLATLTTAAISSITSTTAISGGNITNNGGANITARGVVWNTSQNPTLSNNLGSTTNGTGTGSFTSSITGLTIGTTYYVRAYATNSAGTNFGNQISFTTITIPTVSTTNASSITSSTAISGGSVTNGGGANVTARGVVWNTSQNPTLSNNLGSTTNGTGTGSFTSNITGLTANTTYYVRAYATNSAGTAYGNQVSFTTSASGGIVSNPGAGVTFNGYTYSSIVLGNGQEWMAENLRTTTYANGDPIPNVTDNTQWENLTIGAWTHYNNDSLYENPYGKLYNGYAATDSRNVCPTGWHVPTDAEWNSFIGYLDPSCNPSAFDIQSTTAGGKMKSTGTQYWQSPNQDATNESGFSGLPGSYRYVEGTFFHIGGGGIWWSSTEYNTGIAWHRSLHYNDGNVYRYKNNKKGGFSVRCLKD